MYNTFISSQVIFLFSFSMLVMSCVRCMVFINIHHTTFSCLSTYLFVVFVICRWFESLFFSLSLKKPIAKLILCVVASSTQFVMNYLKVSQTITPTSYIYLLCVYKYYAYCWHIQNKDKSNQNAHTHYNKQTTKLLSVFFSMEIISALHIA